MRRAGRVFTAVLTLSACHEPGPDGAAASPSFGDDDGVDGGDEDDEANDCEDVSEGVTCPGTEDPKPKRVEPTCNVEFPTLEPVWLVEESGPLEDDGPTVLDIAVTDDAMFLANWDDVSNVRSPGSIERRSLTGELVWARVLDQRPYRIAWDGQHLYVAIHDRVRRWDGDGVEDTWSFQAFGVINAIAVNADTVALGGEFMIGDIHENNMDAFYGQLTKTMPIDYLGYVMPTERAWDRTQALTASPWGGWIAGGSVSGSFDDHVWMHGYGGHRFVGTMQPYDTSHAEAMFPGDDVLYVVGWSNSSPSGHWLSAFDQEGDQLWSRDVWICPGAGAGIGDLTLAGGVIVGLATSKNAAGDYPPLLAKVSLDGEVLGVWRVGTGDDLSLMSLGVDGERLLVGGRRFQDGQSQRIVAEVRP